LGSSSLAEYYEEQAQWADGNGVVIFPREKEYREQIRREARKLKGVRFPDRDAGEHAGLLEFVDDGLNAPETLSCSQFVRCAVNRAFGPDFWSRLVDNDYAAVAVNGGARTMWQALESVDDLRTGDLRFFGDDGSDDWHVMMVVDHATLIGACPRDSVREVRPFLGNDRPRDTENAPSDGPR